MRKIHSFSLLVLSVLFFACNNNTTYYIDPATGDDSHTGKSEENAWKTTAKLAAIKLKAGDSILLKGGEVFAGEVIVNSVSGTSQKRIVISSYGNGKAVIEAGKSSGLTLNNCSFLSISNLIIRGDGRLNGNNGNGLKLFKCSNTLAEHIEAAGFMWSGINIEGGNNIEILHSHTYDNGFCGIYAEPLHKEYGADGSAFKTLRNLRIAYCIAGNNPGCPLIKDNHSGNGILIGGVVNGVIEFCEAFNNGWDMPREGNGPVGIWAYMCDSVLIQYCYSHHNKTSEKGKDGGGFDFDGGITNSVMQYNVSAFNEGAGYGIFQYAGATRWENNILRYNISYNDGSKNGQAGILMWYDPTALPMKNFEAYHNTIINNYQYGINFEPGSYEGFQFLNNILYLSVKSPRFVGGDFSGAVFRNNNYWSAAGDPQPSIIYDSEPLAGDPLLVLPGRESDFSFKTGDFSSLRYFMLLPGSPCAGKAYRIGNGEEYDSRGRVFSANIGADVHSR